MSGYNRDVLNSKVQLEKYLKTSIYFDEGTSIGHIKVGDTLKGHVVINNRKVLSCKDIYVGVMGKSRVATIPPKYYACKFAAVSFLIKHGKTQDGIPMNIKSIPKGTHTFPFTLSLPDAFGMNSTFISGYAQNTYELQVLVVFPSGMHQLCCMPITIHGNWNIRSRQEDIRPIEHYIKQSKFQARKGIILTLPQKSYIAEDVMMLTIDIGGWNGKIKEIELTFMKKQLMRFLGNVQYEKYEPLVSKKITDISDVMVEELCIPGWVPEMETFSCRSSQSAAVEVFWAEQTYILRIVIKTAGKPNVTDQIPINIGTVDKPVVSMNAMRNGSATPLTIRSITEYPRHFESSAALPPIYSELSSPVPSRPNSVTSLETLPPTFEEAVKRSSYVG